MNIRDLLICPVCRCCLSDSLECNNCHHLYSYEYGVYDVVSQKLSGDQKILWTITDETIEKDTVQSRKPDEGVKPDWEKDYYARMSDETKRAQQKQFDFMGRLIPSLSGVVCDLATGRGKNLERLLTARTSDLRIVCTDIDKRILAMTRKNKKTDDSRVFYVATDGRYLSIKDNSFDYITSAAAFGNIPESDKVAGEMYRTLKFGGELIIEGTYIEKGSESFELAKKMGLEKGMTEKYLTQELRNAGFQNIASTVVAKAVWAENPYDVLTVAGDMQYFCVIQAKKPD